MPRKVLLDSLKVEQSEIAPSSRDRTARIYQEGPNEAPPETIAPAAPPQRSPGKPSEDHPNQNAQRSQVQIARGNYRSLAPG